MADAAPGGAPHSTTPPATKAKPRLEVGRVSGGPPGQAGSEAEHQGMRPAAFPTPRAVGQAAQTAVTETRWPASKAEGGRELRAAGRGPQAKDCGRPLKSGEAQKQVLPQSPQKGTQPCPVASASHFGPMGP